VGFHLQFVGAFTSDRMEEQPHTVKVADGVVPTLPPSAPSTLWDDLNVVGAVRPLSMVGEAEGLVMGLTTSSGSVFNGTGVFGAGGTSDVGTSHIIESLISVPRPQNSSVDEASTTRLKGFHPYTFGPGVPSVVPPPQPSPVFLPQQPQVNHHMHQNSTQMMMPQTQMMTPSMWHHQQMHMYMQMQMQMQMQAQMQMQMQMRAYPMPQPMLAPYHLPGPHFHGYSPNNEAQQWTAGSLEQRTEKNGLNEYSSSGTKNDSNFTISAPAASASAAAPANAAVSAQAPALSSPLDQTAPPAKGKSARKPKETAPSTPAIPSASSAPAASASAAAPECSPASASLLSVEPMPASLPSSNNAGRELLSFLKKGGRK